MKDLWDDADEQQEDDVPWADPRIQEDYERSLGRFLVAFNQIEGLVSDLIILALQEVDRQAEIPKALDQGFNNRVTYLKARLQEMPDLPSIRSEELVALAKRRNSLAHGHFEQNPFSGDYEIIGRDKVAEQWSPETIEPLIQTAHELWDHLRWVWAAFCFEKID